MPLETDKQGGFKFSLGEVLNTGLYPDMFARRSPMWGDGSNIIFTHLGVEKLNGWQQLIDTTNGEPIRGLMQNQENNGAFKALYAGDLTQLYRIDAYEGTFDVVGTGYNLTEASGSALWDLGASVWDNGGTTWDFGTTKADHWSMVPFGEWALATYGGTPVIRKGTGNFVPVTGLGAVNTIEIFQNMGPHILGFNTDVSPKEFIWCDADDPDTWVAAADNLAGQLEIRELKSDIIAVVPIGPRLAVYGTDQMFLVNYLANDLVFGYQAALNGIGAVSKKAVVSVGRENYGLSEQGFFVTDGASFQYIDEPATRSYYAANANKAQISKAFAFHDETNTQIRWYFPTNSSLITGGVSYNYITKTWSIIENTLSAGDERRVIESPLSGSETGIIYKENTGNNAAGSPMVSWVRTKAVDLQNADLVKEIDSVRVGLTGMGLTYRIGWSETETGTITWNDYTDIEVGFEFHNLRTAGRWLHFELRSDTLNARWEVSDLEFIGRMEGTR